MTRLGIKSRKCQKTYGTAQHFVKKSGKGIKYKIHTYIHLCILKSQIIQFHQTWYCLLCIYIALVIVRMIKATMADDLV